MWVTFRDGLHALSAVKKEISQICGHRIRLSLKTPDWLAQFRSEIALCSNNTIPLAHPLPPLNFNENLTPGPVDISGRASPSGPPPSRPPLPNVHKPKAGVVSLPTALMKTSISPGDYESPIGGPPDVGVPTQNVGVPLVPTRPAPSPAMAHHSPYAPSHPTSNPGNIPPILAPTHPPMTYPINPTSSPSPPSQPPPLLSNQYEICDHTSSASCIYEEISDDHSTPAPLGPPPPLPPINRQAPPLPSRQGVPSRPGIPPPIPNRNTPPATPKKTVS